MDETLIGTAFDQYGNMVPVPRPYLKEFLDFVFSSFYRVSIWTNARSDWFRQVYRKVLRPRMPPGKDFDFVRCRPKEYLLDGCMTFSWLKSLDTIFQDPRYAPYYHANNTFLFDDSREHGRINPETNFIVAVPFHADNSFDRHLLDVQNHILLRMVQTILEVSPALTVSDNELASDES